MFLVSTKWCNDNCCYIIHSQYTFFSDWLKCPINLHNKLVLTKYGKWRQQCRLSLGKGNATARSWERGCLSSVHWWNWKNWRKMSPFFEEEIAELHPKKSLHILNLPRNWKNLYIVRGKRVLVCFLSMNYFKWIIKQLLLSAIIWST